MFDEDDKRRTAELPASSNAGRGHVASGAPVLHPAQSVNYASVLGRDEEPLRAALAVFDKNGDGEVCPAELIEAHQAFERMKAEKVLFRKLLIAAVVLCFVMVGATVGLTAAVVITTKESKVSSSGLLRANDGSETPVRTAERRGTVTTTPAATGARLARRSLLQTPTVGSVVATAQCATASKWFEDIATEGFTADIVIQEPGDGVSSISCRATSVSPPNTIDGYDQARPSETYQVDCSAVDLDAGGADCFCLIYLTGSDLFVDATPGRRRKLEERSSGNGVSAGEVLAAAARHLGVAEELTLVGSVLREQGVAIARSAMIAAAKRHLVQLRTATGRSVAAQAVLSGGMRTDDGWHLAEWTSYGSRGALVCPPAVGDAHLEGGDCHVLARGTMRRSLLGAVMGAEGPQVEGPRPDDRELHETCSGECLLERCGRPDITSESACKAAHADCNWRAEEGKCTGACFSGDATLTTVGGDDLRIGDVRVGQRVAVLAPDGRAVFSPVIAVSHNEPEAVRAMVTVQTAAGKALSATPDHYIFVRCDACAGGRERVRFDAVRAGEHEVAAVSGGKAAWVVVTGVLVENKVGLHVVHTASGWPLVVSGVGASEYSDNGLEPMGKVLLPVAAVLARVWPSGMQALCDVLMALAHGASGETAGWEGTVVSKLAWRVLRASSRALGGATAAA
ncbi:unnamed protein product [Pedinophyceae sp. YPF-701]|nr:unnamed protein product [Pedinophyceae sp. YPF-701]